MPDDRTSLFLRALSFPWKEIDFSATGQARRVPPPALQRSVAGGLPEVRLPAFDTLPRSPVSLTDALVGRISRRKFSDAALTLEELSFLLHCTQGVRADKGRYSLRSVPSAGARHALETTLYVDRVDGLDRGLYLYRPLGHSLVQLRPFDAQMAAAADQALMDQLYGAAVVFFWTAVPDRMAWRYSFATAKLLALDAGHVCQNLYLACEAVGCGTCAVGAYDQELTDAFLGIDGESEFTLYAGPVGKLPWEAGR